MLPRLNIGWLLGPLLVIVASTDANAQVQFGPAIAIFISAVILSLCLTTALAVGAAAVAFLNSWYCLWWFLLAFVILAALSIPFALRESLGSFWNCLWALSGVVFVAVCLIIAKAEPSKRLRLLAIAIIPNVISFTWTILGQTGGF